MVGSGISATQLKFVIWKCHEIHSEYEVKHKFYIRKSYISKPFLFINRSKNFMRNMWVSILGPYLDYGCRLLTPNEGLILAILEKIQMDFHLH